MHKKRHTARQQLIHSLFAAVFLAMRKPLAAHRDACRALDVNPNLESHKRGTYKTVKARFQPFSLITCSIVLAHNLSAADS